MNRQPTLSDATLLLRPLVPDDWAALFAVAQDREIWAQHPMHDRWQEPVFRAFFAEALDCGGALVALEKAGGEVIGSSRYDGYGAADGGSVEIGWTFLARSHWGGGWNHAMKRLMLAHAFTQVARVDFRIGEDNRRSRIACERIGARLTDRVDDMLVGNRTIRHVVYAIGADDFRHSPLGGP